MGNIKPQYIANLIVELSINFEFKKLETVVFESMKLRFKTFSDEDLLEYAEQNHKIIARELFEKENAASLDGVKLNFDIKEEDDGFYIKFIDQPETKLLQKLQADTSDNFESFCGRILEALGGLTNVNGGKEDGGIDFTATDLMLKNIQMASTQGSKIVVIGQAKRYKNGNHVTEKEIREFVGSSIKRIEDFKRTRSEQYGIFQPTILAFWTTSDFHLSGRDYAKQMGIWYLNGMALCQLALKLKVE